MIICNDFLRNAFGTFFMRELPCFAFFHAIFGKAYNNILLFHASKLVLLAYVVRFLLQILGVCLSLMLYVLFLLLAYGNIKFRIPMDNQ